MNAVTVTTDQVMMAILGLVGMYTILYNIKWIWETKKALFHVSLVIMVVGSATGLFLNRVDEVARVQSEANAARIAQIRLVRESREAPVTTPLPECADPKQANLPGAWWGLYQTVIESSFWEAKLLAIEAFPIHYGLTEIEPLPVIGFNHILVELNVKGDNERTSKHVNRVKKVLEPYLSPFNEAPICFAKATPKVKKEKDEKKNG